jgi:osmoprotectant transport system permease protein
VALPAGIYLGQRAARLGPGGADRLSLAVINAANIGRALPSLAILAFALPVAFRFGLGLGFWPTVLMLIPLGVPLILISTFTAVSTVDPDVLEVARGLGMRQAQVLRRVQLPLAAPLIIAGIRTAAVTLVATATLGALVASGGLGRYIIDGLARREDERLLAGALLVAALSILTELAFAFVQRLAQPRSG